MKTLSRLFWGSPPQIKQKEKQKTLIPFFFRNLLVCWLGLMSSSVQAEKVLIRSFPNPTIEQGMVGGVTRSTRIYCDTNDDKIEFAEIKTVFSPNIDKYIKKHEKLHQKQFEQMNNKKEGVSCQVILDRAISIERSKIMEALSYLQNINDGDVLVSIYQEILSTENYPGTQALAAKIRNDKLYNAYLVWSEEFKKNGNKATDFRPFEDMKKHVKLKLQQVAAQWEPFLEKNKSQPGKYDYSKYITK